MLRSLLQNDRGNERFAHTFRLSGRESYASKIVVLLCDAQFINYEKLKKIYFRMHYKFLPAQKM